MSEPTNQHGIGVHSGEVVGSHMYDHDLSAGAADAPTIEDDDYEDVLLLDPE